MASVSILALRALHFTPGPNILVDLYTVWTVPLASVPDDTFEKATRRAHDLGMSRSEFFARAAARYLDELDAESVTRQIDLAVVALAGGDDSAADAVAVAHRILGNDAPGDW